jgi:hypothetical protein
MVCVEAQQFDEQGTLLFDKNEIPLNEEEWQQLETLIHAVDYEHVVGGDAGEGHSVHVCRFYNDVDKPAPLNEKSDEIKAIVMSKKMKAFYKRFTDTEQLCLRRCQANLLYKNDYIGLHKDQDSNPDYFATVVFHFGSKYRGGAFVTHGEDGDSSYHPISKSVLVNNCFIPHEVTAVEQGERRTLACFLSKEFSDSKNSRQQFRMAE